MWNLVTERPASGRLRRQVGERPHLLSQRAPAFRLLRDLFDHLGYDPAMCCAASAT